MRIKSAVVGALAFIGLSAGAGEMATLDEAKAMSERAAALVNQTGEAAFTVFADEQGEFMTKDLYVFCMDLEGKMLSHPKKPHLVGKNLSDFNKYGDLLFRDMITVANVKGSGWVHYRWPYPGTEAIRKKGSFIIKNDKGFFCGVGAYL